MVSEDLDEIFELSDRIAVFYNGRVVGVARGRRSRPPADRAHDGGRGVTGPLRIERRLDAPGWLKVAVPVASLVLAAIIVGILLLATGHNPLSTYHQMYSAAITADGALSSTFVYATPLLFTGLCAAFAFRMRTWNIGGEGQLYMGAVGASATGPRARRLAPPAAHHRHDPRRCPRRDALG